MSKLKNRAHKTTVAKRFCESVISQLGNIFRNWKHVLILQLQHATFYISRDCKQNQNLYAVQMSVEDWLQKQNEIIST